MNLFDSINKQGTKHALLEKSFENVFKQVRLKVEQATKKNKTDILFEIKEFQIGYMAIRNEYVESCKSYIKRKLSGKGIQIKPTSYNNPRIIHVTWRKFIQKKFSDPSSLNIIEQNTYTNKIKAPILQQNNMMYDNTVSFSRTRRDKNYFKDLNEKILSIV